MKIKIDEGGHLWIERAGKFKVQDCPDDNDGAKCGDWCPLFGEPSSVGEVPSPDFMRLDICQEKTLYGEIIDERQKGGSDEK